MKTESLSRLENPVLAQKVVDLNFIAFRSVELKSRFSMCTL